MGLTAFNVFLDTFFCHFFSCDFLSHFKLTFPYGFLSTVYFFLFATVFLGPLRVRALVLVF